MTITCFIRYEIDPFGKAAFEQYAKAWGQAIPRCGAEQPKRYLPSFTLTAASLPAAWLSRIRV